MIWQFFEKTALDWVLILFRPNEYFPWSNTFSQSNIEKIKDRLNGADQGSLDEIVNQLKERLADEEKRRGQIESKAQTLQGFTVLAGSFIVGFGQFLIGTTNLNGPLRILIVVAYICIASSLLMTITLARKAVSTAKFTYPKPSDWLSLRDWNREIIVKQYIVDLYTSIDRNTDTINDKATFLNGAEDWIRNVTWLLSLLIFILVFVTFNAQSSSTDQPINVIVVTPTETAILTPTLTDTPIPTSTIILSPIINATATP